MAYGSVSGGLAGTLGGFVGAYLGSLWGSWAFWGRLGGLLGAFWRLLAGFLRVLEIKLASNIVMDSFRCPGEPSWRCLGVVFVVFGGSFGLNFEAF